MIKQYLELIKFSHTLFALPFALIAVLVAAEGSPSLYQIFWVVIAMVGARSGAMGFNRWADRKFDAENPRTQKRPSVTGAISPQSVLGFTLMSYAVLVLAAYQLNTLAFYLSPLAIFLTMFYSLTKRFTAYSHFFLGLAIGIAPIAAWISIKGEIALPALVLGCSVLCWIAGFDILYALQDLDFDRKTGLFSIPARLGIERSLSFSRGLHGTTLILWITFYLLTPLNTWFLVGILVGAGLLFWEHWLLRGGNLQKLDTAFFNMNGYISLSMLLFTGLACWA